VGIVTRQAIARRLIMYVAALAAFHLAVTCEAQLGGSCRQQLDARDVFGDAYFMAAETVLLRGRVRVLVLGLILMAADAGGCRYIRVQWSGMLLRRGETRQEGNDDRQDKPRDRRPCV